MMVYYWFLGGGVIFLGGGGGAVSPLHTMYRVGQKKPSPKIEILEYQN